MGDMDENEFGIYLFNKSLEIEPRGSKAPVKMVIILVVMINSFFYLLYFIIASSLA